MKAMLNKKTLTLVSLLLFLFLLVGCFPNRPPVITSDPVTTATVGKVYTYDIDATDPNAGDVLNYSLITEPDGMLINGTNGVITWIPDASGKFEVTVEVSDGALSDTQSFTITVSEPPTINQAPIIYSTPITVATIGVLYTYNVDAIDPDGDKLIYFLTTKPKGMVINSATGVINWKPTSIQVGRKAVIVKVSDGDLSDTQSFKITVSKPGPELTGIKVVPETMTLFVEESETIKSITAHYSDGSEDILVLGDCTYASSTTGVATVSNGVVTAIAKGTATITVSYGGKTDTLAVTVNPVLLTSIVVLPETMTLSVRGSGTLTLVTAHYNDGSTADIALGSCTYASSDVLVATVLAGKISALTPGTATITVTYADMTDTIEVTVSSIRLTSIVVEPDKMTLIGAGDSEDIESVTAHYSDGKEADIDLDACSYKSSDESVATVSDAGLIEAVAYGEATITVTYTEEEITKGVYVVETDTIEVTVIDLVHNTTQGEYYHTIQTAIGDARAGETIEVAAGTYNEDVTIDKPLTLLGANADVNPVTEERRPESIIDLQGLWAYKAVGITAGNVVFDGFTVRDCPSHCFSYGIYAVTSADNCRIQNNIVRGNGETIGICGYGGDNCQVSNNLITDTSVGIELGGINNLTISGNKITGCTGAAEGAINFGAEQNFANIAIENNIIEDNAGSGIYFGEHMTLTGIEVHYNNIVNNAKYGILNEISTIVDATNNWWGSVNGPYHPISNPLGTGDAVSDNVDFKPWSNSPN